MNRNKSLAELLRSILDAINALANPSVQLQQVKIIQIALADKKPNERKEWLSNN
jgi:hypothetical protein